MTESILERVRKDGYRKGVEDQKFYQSQFSMMQSDEDYLRGYSEAEANQPSRLGWGVIGFTIGLVFSFWFNWVF